LLESGLPTALLHMQVVISKKGAIVSPVEFRRQDDVKQGEEFEIQRLARSEYLLKRTKPRRNEGVVELLLNSPVKGWFRPMSRLETTDEIGPS
jgi:bifunctional DNA-binding transcriptional regulator/antitoxin component of YhaV-PrlF toxin-antitoxin module